MDALEKNLLLESENKKLKKQLAEAAKAPGATVFKETIDYCKPRKNGKIRIRQCLVGSETEQKLKNQGWQPKYDPIATTKANAKKKADAQKAAEAEAANIAAAQKAAGKGKG